MTKKARSSNIELLRILSIIGVILLHYNHPYIGGAMAAVTPGSISQFILYFAESVSIVAVNLFVLITGYFLSATQKRQPYKIIWLLLQVVLFSGVVYLWDVLVYGDPFSWKALLEALVPNNYFVLLYGALYFISPYLNLVLNSLDRPAMRKLLILSGLLFCVYPTLVDLSGDILGRSWNGLYTISSQGSQQGYTIVNFVLMYLLGGFLRTAEPKKEKPGFLLLVILGNSLLITVWYLAGEALDLPTDRSGLAYCNPFVIVNALLIFRLFQNLPEKENKLINHLAKGVFTAFLLHIRFFRYIHIPQAVSAGPIVLIFHMVLSGAAIYLLCWGIYFLYNLVTRPVFAFIEKKLPLPQLDVPIP